MVWIQCPTTFKFPPDQIFFHHENHTNSLRGDYYEQTASTIIIKMGQTPIARFYLVLRVFGRSSIKRERPSFPAFCCYLRSASPSLPAQSWHRSRRSSAAFCRVVESGLWGGGAGERSRGRKKEKSNRYQYAWPTLWLVFQADTRRWDLFFYQWEIDVTQLWRKSFFSQQPMGAGCLPLDCCVIDPLYF